MYRNKGTITVFLSLISMLFLSLFCTMAESVRVQAARFQAAAAFDMGLFSIFGEYDRVLLEEYDLWFLDGSSEEQKIREVLETKLEKYIQPNINPRYNLAAGRSWDVFPTELDRCTVDKYALWEISIPDIIWQQEEAGMYFPQSLIDVRWISMLLRRITVDKCFTVRLWKIRKNCLSGKRHQL